VTACTRPSRSFIDELRRPLPAEHPRPLPEPAELRHAPITPTCRSRTRTRSVGTRSAWISGSRMAVIEDVRFSGRDARSVKAAASMLTEEILGKTLDEVKRIGKDNVLEMLGIEAGARPAQVRAACAQDAENGSLWSPGLARRGRGGRMSGVTARYVRWGRSRKCRRTAPRSSMSRIGRSPSIVSKTGSMPSTTSARTTAAPSRRGRWTGTR
jgi:hypothetical protein